MLTKRIIPCLDINDGRVVKGVKFNSLKDAGDPVELASEYNRQGADELTMLDIGASYQNRNIMLEVVEKVSSQIFIPLTVGGGIRSLDDMRQVLLAGADKVSICSAVLKDPSLIKRAAEIFGSQCIVISIDAKRTGNSWNCYLNGGRIDTGIDAVQWAIDCVQWGAGEILLNSIDADGTKYGYDLELTSTISEKVSIPVIASGGAGKPEHMMDALITGKADAVLAASILHFGTYTVTDIKNYLRNKGVSIR